ncbi:MAG: signal peptidase I [Bacteroidales bacterium]
MIKLIEKKPNKKQIIWFSIVSVLYILWIIWMRSYWMLIGLAIIFDIYISKKVNWNIFKQKPGEKKKWKEWADALVFALVVSTLIKIFIFQLYAIPTGSLEKTLLIGDRLFVSKLSYGPQMPMTPVAVPLVHNTIFGVDSYIEWPKWDYKRLSGLGQIERDDIVVFNFPVGDTILVGNENPDYYAHLILHGREFVEKNYQVKTRPIDKEENFVKRCVAIPGDTLTIVDTKVYINGTPQKDYKGIMFKYHVQTDGTSINPKTFERLGINSNDVRIESAQDYFIDLTDERAEEFRKFPNIKKVNKLIEKKGEPDEFNLIFPRDSAHFKWNNDNFGPLVLPKKGMTITLTDENIILYRRVIDVYEKNNYEEKGGKVFIDGKQIDSYTFKQNYYWMMGDNRHNSADSRSWGFVPEDHVVGKPVLIFYSLDEEKSFPSNIRWSRLFKLVRKE